jgi:hypothetical protein
MVKNMFSKRYIQLAKFKAKQRILLTYVNAEHNYRSVIFERDLHGRFFRLLFLFLMLIL